MSLNDTLSDMLSRIKNAHSVKKTHTYCLLSKLNINVLKAALDTNNRVRTDRDWEQQKGRAVI